ncbi:unnamed protein product [Amoebophrya sp. A120]|nr:unnamed protein product [Amoebophrya sp. A120]|eukprot:GSA120T00015898001.1
MRLSARPRARLRARTGHEDKGRKWVRARARERPKILRPCSHTQKSECARKTHSRTRWLLGPARPHENAPRHCAWRAENGRRSCQCSP